MNIFQRAILELKRLYIRRQVRKSAKTILDNIMKEYMNPNTLHREFGESDASLRERRIALLNENNQANL